MRSSAKAKSKSVTPSSTSRMLKTSVLSMTTARSSTRGKDTPREDEDEKGQERQKNKSTVEGGDGNDKIKQNGKERSSKPKVVRATIRSNKIEGRDNSKPRR